MDHCCICGSGNPYLTIGWPVCANEFFHERAMRQRRRRRYTGRHRVKR